MLWTWGWLCLKSMSSFAVYNAKTPKNIVSTRAGAMPDPRLISASSGEGVLEREEIVLTDDGHCVGQR
jgi:hypothetical protein